MCVCILFFNTFLRFYVCFPRGRATTFRKRQNNLKESENYERAAIGGRERSIKMGHKLDIEYEDFFKQICPTLRIQK